MPLLNHFDFLAPFYESVIKPQYPEKLLALAGASAHGTVLDIGGGTGRITQFFTAKAARVLIADASLDMLQQARKKPALHPLCSLAEKLPFADNTIDLVIMVDALHHVIDQPQTAQEMWRVLAPQGRIIIEEPDVRAFSIKLLALGEKLALMRSHFLTPPQIASLFHTPDARVHIEKETTSAWIIVEKQPG